MSHLKIGRKAPQFSLPGADGRTLADMAGHPVVVFFYPQDGTRACTVEATAFSALSPEFVERGAVVVGISPDSDARHQWFARKHDLSIPLVADPQLKIAKAYGVWGDKVLFGRHYKGIIRTTFLIGRDGRVAQVWSKVRVANHAAAVLAAVGELETPGTKSAPASS